jgi:hypothetical protein
MLKGRNAFIFVVLLGLFGLLATLLFMSEASGGPDDQGKDSGYSPVVRGAPVVSKSNSQASSRTRKSPSFEDGVVEKDVDERRGTLVFLTSPGETASPAGTTWRAVPVGGSSNNTISNPLSEKCSINLPRKVAVAMRGSRMGSRSWIYPCRVRRDHIDLGETSSASSGSGHFVSRRSNRECSSQIRCRWGRTSTPGSRTPC